MYKDLYDRAKKIVKKDACMKFYDVSKPIPANRCIGVGLEPDYYRQGMS